MDFLAEMNSDNRFNKELFVSDSYKKMPPVGLEYFNPILNNLWEEVSKINNLQPKIFNVQSKVCNTADSVRNIKL